jgi:glycosyltransferase involved in cell wall biosynthesis
VHCLNTTQRTLLEANRITATRIIPHGIDRRVLPCPERPREVTGGRLRLGFMSRRYASGLKGELIFGSLLDQLDPERVSFLMVGAERSLEAGVARQKGFQVECWDRLPYRLMREVYDRMDALLIISRFEGGPACLPEGLGTGVPVLCTPVGMCLDYVTEGQNGIYLTGRPGPDGAKIMALLDDGARELAALAQGAFLTAPTIPSWDQVMNEWHDLYRAAVDTVH